MYVCNKWLNSSKIDKYFKQICRESQNTLLYSIIFVSKLHAVYDTMWNIVIEPDRPQKAVKCGTEKMRFSCGVNNAMLQKYIIFNIYCLIIY